MYSCKKLSGTKIKKKINVLVKEKEETKRKRMEKKLKKKNV